MDSSFDEVFGFWGALEFPGSTHRIPDRCTSHQDMLENLRKHRQALLQRHHMQWLLLASQQQAEIKALKKKHSEFTDSEEPFFFVGCASQMSGSGTSIWFDGGCLSRQMHCG